MSDNKKIYTQLPATHQTSAIKNFFEATVEQLYSKSNVETIQGFIGAERSQDLGANGEYLTEPDQVKRFYGLSSAVNTVNPDTGSPEHLIFYDEFIQNWIDRYNELDLTKIDNYTKSVLCHLFPNPWDVLFTKERLKECAQHTTEE